MSVCVVVADDAGARTASHALRAIGYGGVHFEAKPDAAVRMAMGGRATVLNVSRCAPDEIAAVLVELGPMGFDWRVDPPDLSQDEWGVLYGIHTLTERTAANRLKSATEKLGAGGFEPWRLPVA